MKMTFKEIKYKDTIIEFSSIPIEQCETNLIINWLGSDYVTGPPSCVNIVKVGGLMLNNYIMNYYSTNNEYDCFVTLPGMLPCSSIIHCVINDKVNYDVMFQNVADTIRTYAKDNICKSIAIPLPINVQGMGRSLVRYLTNLGFKRIVIISNDYLVGNKGGNEVLRDIENLQENKGILLTIDDFVMRIIKRIGNHETLIDKLMVWRKKKTYGNETSKTQPGTD